MQIGFKAVVAMFVATTCVQPVAADNAVGSRVFSQFATQAWQAFATGLVDAEIQRSCFIQTTVENRIHVANEAECREALDELLTALSEGEYLEDQVAQIKNFRAQYGI